MMTPSPAPPPGVLDALRARLAALEPRAAWGVWGFGDARVDDCLAGRGLALGALHEVAATGIEGETGAACAGFLAGVLGGLTRERPGRVFWIGEVADLHPAGLLGLGLDPGCVVQVQTPDDAGTLAALETVLRGGAAVAAVGEIGRVGRIAGRRLQLACLKHGVTGFVLRRFPYGRKGAEEAAGSAVTRWRVAPAPSALEGDSGRSRFAAAGDPGRPRWRVELVHARGGVEGAWIMEAMDMTGGFDAAHPFRVVAELADAAVAAPDARAGWRSAG